MSAGRLLATGLALALLLGPAGAKEKAIDPASPEAIQQALQEMAQPEYATRRAAALRLFSGGMPAVAPLVEALKKAEAAHTVRMPALATLKEAYGGEPRAAELRHLLGRITGHNARTATGWATWLDKHKDDTRESLVGADLRFVSETLKNLRDPAGKRRVLEIIARVGDEALMKTALGLMGDKDAQVRRGACRAMAETTQAKRAAALKGLFGDKESPVRRDALSAAAVVGLPDAKGVLKAALNDAKHPIERAHAVLGLARLGEETALDAAAKGLGQRAEQNFQLLYAEALSCFPKDEVVKALQKALGLKETNHPLMPAAALAALGDRAPRTLKPFEDAMKAALPPPNPKDPGARVRARQDRLFAARSVADVLSDQPALRGLANDTLRSFAQDTNAAIDKGVKALKALREKKAKNEIGSWSFKTSGWPFPSFQNGASALALLALLKSGVPKDDPDVVLGLTYVLSGVDQPPKLWGTMVYPQAMCIALLSEMDPSLHRARIKGMVDWLQAGQITAKTDPIRQGQWNYMADQTPFQASNSNTHFALLGLCYASRKVDGLLISNDFWRDSLDYWLRMQRLNGGWNYGKAMGAGDSYGTMTAAGVTSLLICQAGFLEKDFPEFDPMEYTPVRDGLGWLEDHFDDALVPDLAAACHGGNGSDYRYYWFYAVERMALVLGTEYVGNRHWYHDIASRILELQSPDGAWIGEPRCAETPPIASSFALLVLVRAPLPIQIQPPATYLVEESLPVPPPAPPPGAQEPPPTATSDGSGGR
jgi:HEAT repeat protein